jgi:tannase/feruloyl esterase
MVPGMQHCSGGPGPDSFDSLTALEQWVEQGIAPKQIIASKLAAGVVTRTRPLCRYPQVARYKGKGSTDDAANFRCVKPRHEGNDEDDDD